MEPNFESADKVNLLLALHRLARQQDENFTTEAFAHLLRYLIQHEAATAVKILRYLTGGRVHLGVNDCASVKITTQERSAEGQPDIKIVVPGYMVIVEVKVAARLSQGQILNYRKVLEESGQGRTCLVLLTAVPTDFKDPGEEPDLAVRWHEVAEWLEHVSEELETGTGAYLCTQFLEFLRGRALTMERVGWELEPGIQALSNFRDMLEKCLKSLKGKITAGSGGYSTAFCYHSASRHFWIGIEFTEPTVVKLIEYEGKIARGREVSEIKRDLASEDTHFFALSKEHQIQWLEQFVRDGVSAVAQQQAKSS